MQVFIKVCKKKKSIVGHLNTCPYTMYSTMHLILALTFQFITIYFDFQEIKVKEAHSGHLGSILQGGFGQFFSVDIGTWSPFVFYMYGDSSIVIDKIVPQRGGYHWLPPNSLLPGYANEWLGIKAPWLVCRIRGFFFSFLFGRCSDITFHTCFSWLGIWWLWFQFIYWIQASQGCSSIISYDMNFIRLRPVSFALVQPQLLSTPFLFCGLSYISQGGLEKVIEDWPRTIFVSLVK